eukprot:TRINITY_DN60737_c0_g1_i1.p1 TRINITY_DN60737_c0_g1~~TRINITY_DN60737_c0_g1_i1.p1  ORF type:complete len:830 (+),score=130.82 TRINITY_DN60737_c0_g1_i1:77-2491(+)
MPGTAVGTHSVGLPPTVGEIGTGRRTGDPSSAVPSNSERRLGGGRGASQVSGSESQSFLYLDHGLPKYAERRRAESSNRVTKGTGGSANDGGPSASIALSSCSSRLVREYEAKLKAIDLRTRGIEKSVVAARLGRSERWVQKWWNREPRLLERPHGAQQAVFSRAPLEGFRDVELTKNMVQDNSLFGVLDRAVPWRRGKVMTRDVLTGELVLRFDAHGNTIPASRLVSDCPKGIDPLDALLRKVFSQANIRDPQARVVLNMYTDGTKQLNSHRHDYWTCLVSLGASRVLLVDNRPFIMEDGDMIVFGTQLHGVPPMPEVVDGRISLVVFFYPDRDNLERRWLTVLGSELDGDGCGQAEAIMDEETDETCGTLGTLMFGDDCRAGSRSSVSVLGSSELSALQEALDQHSVRDRPHWRASNAELQFMEFPKLPSAIVYSAGCGLMSEAAFFSELSRQGVAVVWDLRTQGSVRAAVRDGTCAAHFVPERLQASCRGRQRYREWPLGRRSAGGLAHHLFRTEEGATLVYRMLKEAQNTVVCFLGLASNWREDDLRQSMAVALTAAGGQVVHLHGGGVGLSGRLTGETAVSPVAHVTEGHPADFQLPVRLQPPRSDAQYLRQEASPLNGCDPTSCGANACSIGVESMNQGAAIEDLQSETHVQPFTTPLAPAEDPVRGNVTSREPDVCVSNRVPSSASAALSAKGMVHEVANRTRRWAAPRACTSSESTHVNPRASGSDATLPADGATPCVALVTSVVSDYRGGSGLVGTGAGHSVGGHNAGIDCGRWTRARGRKAIATAIALGTTVPS